MSDLQRLRELVLSSITSEKKNEDREEGELSDEEESLRLQSIFSKTPTSGNTQLGDSHSTPDSTQPSNASSGGKENSPTENTSQPVPTPAQLTEGTNNSITSSLTPDASQTKPVDGTAQDEAHRFLSSLNIPVTTSAPTELATNNLGNRQILITFNDEDDDDDDHKERKVSNNSLGSLLKPVRTKTAALLKSNALQLDIEQMKKRIAEMNGKSGRGVSETSNSRVTVASNQKAVNNKRVTENLKSIKSDSLVLTAEELRQQILAKTNEIERLRLLGLKNAASKDKIVKGDAFPQLNIRNTASNSSAFKSKSLTQSTASLANATAIASTSTNPSTTVSKVITVSKVSVSDPAKSPAVVQKPSPYSSISEASMLSKPTATTLASKSSTKTVKNLNSSSNLSTAVSNSAAPTDSDSLNTAIASLKVSPANKNLTVASNVSNGQSISSPSQVSNISNVSNSKNGPNVSNVPKMSGISNANHDSTVSTTTNPVTASTASTVTNPLTVSTVSNSKNGPNVSNVPKVSGISNANHDSTVLTTTNPLTVSTLTNPLTVSTVSNSKNGPNVSNVPKVSGISNANHDSTVLTTTNPLTVSTLTNPLTVSTVSNSKNGPNVSNVPKVSGISNANHDSTVLTTTNPLTVSTLTNPLTVSTVSNSKNGPNVSNVPKVSGISNANHDSTVSSVSSPLTVSTVLNPLTVSTVTNPITVSSVLNPLTVSISPSVSNTPSAFKFLSDSLFSNANNISTVSKDLSVSAPLNLSKENNSQQNVLSVKRPFSDTSLPSSDNSENKKQKRAIIADAIEKNDVFSANGDDELHDQINSQKNENILTVCKNSSSLQSSTPSAITHPSPVNQSQETSGRSSVPSTIIEQKTVEENKIKNMQSFEEVNTFSENNSKKKFIDNAFTRTNTDNVLSKSANDVNVESKTHKNQSSLVSIRPSLPKQSSIEQFSSFQPTSSALLQLTSSHLLSASPLPPSNRQTNRNVQNQNFLLNSSFTVDQNEIVNDVKKKESVSAVELPNLIGNLYEDEELKKLKEEEYKVEEELENVQKVRRDFELREKYARQALREAQEALWSVQEHCTMLEERREFVTNHFQIAMRKRKLEIQRMKLHQSYQFSDSIPPFPLTSPPFPSPLTYSPAPSPAPSHPRFYSPSLSFSPSPLSIQSFASHNSTPVSSDLNERNVYMDSSKTNTVNAFPSYGLSPLPPFLPTSSPSTLPLSSSTSLSSLPSSLPHLPPSSSFLSDKASPSIPHSEMHSAMAMDSKERILSPHIDLEKNEAQNTSSPFSFSSLPSFPNQNENNIDHLIHTKQSVLQSTFSTQALDSSEGKETNIEKNIPMNQSKIDGINIHMNIHPISNSISNERINSDENVQEKEEEGAGLKVRGFRKDMEIDTHQSIFFNEKNLILTEENEKTFLLSETNRFLEKVEEKEDEEEETKGMGEKEGKGETEEEREKMGEEEKEEEEKEDEEKEKDEKEGGKEEEEEMKYSNSLDVVMDSYVDTNIENVSNVVYEMGEAMEKEKEKEEEVMEEKRIEEVEKEAEEQEQKEVEEVEKEVKEIEAEKEEEENEMMINEYSMEEVSHEKIVQESEEKLKEVIRGKEDGDDDAHKHVDVIKSSGEEIQKMDTSSDAILLVSGENNRMQETPQTHVLPTPLKQKNILNEPPVADVNSSGKNNRRRRRKEAVNIIREEGKGNLKGESVSPSGVASQIKSTKEKIAKGTEKEKEYKIKEEKNYKKDKENVVVEVNSGMEEEEEGEEGMNPHILKTMDLSHELSDYSSDKLVEKPLKHNSKAIIHTEDSPSTKFPKENVLNDIFSQKNEHSASNPLPLKGCLHPVTSLMVKSTSFLSHIQYRKLKRSNSSKFDSEKDKKETSSKTSLDFVTSQYVSPLTRLRSYRVTPQFASVFHHSFSSLTWCHQIDPFKQLCMYESRGVCNDNKCQYQHFREFIPSIDNVINQINAYLPSPSITNPEEKSNLSENQKVKPNSDSKHTSSTSNSNLKSNLATSVVTAAAESAEKNLPHGISADSALKIEKISKDLIQTAFANVSGLHVLNRPAKKTKNPLCKQRSIFDQKTPPLYRLLGEKRDGVSTSPPPPPSSSLDASSPFSSSYMQASELLNDFYYKDLRFFQRIKRRKMGMNIPCIDASRSMASMPILLPSSTLSDELDVEAEAKAPPVEEDVTFKIKFMQNKVKDDPSNIELWLDLLQLCFSSATGYKVVYENIDKLSHYLMKAFQFNPCSLLLWKLYFYFHPIFVMDEEKIESLLRTTISSHPANYEAWCMYAMTRTTVEQNVNALEEGIISIANAASSSSHSLSSSSMDSISHQILDLALSRLSAYTMAEKVEHACAWIEDFVHDFQLFSRSSHIPMNSLPLKRTSSKSILMHLTPSHSCILFVSLSHFMLHHSLPLPVLSRLHHEQDVSSLLSFQWEETPATTVNSKKDKTIALSLLRLAYENFSAFLSSTLLAQTDMPSSDSTEVVNVLPILAIHYIQLLSLSGEKATAIDICQSASYLLPHSFELVSLLAELSAQQAGPEAGIQVWEQVWASAASGTKPGFDFGQRHWSAYAGHAFQFASPSDSLNVLLRAASHAKILKIVCTKDADMAEDNETMQGMHFVSKFDLPVERRGRTEGKDLHGRRALNLNPVSGSESKQEKRKEEEEAVREMQGESDTSKSNTVYAWLNLGVLEGMLGNERKSMAALDRALHEALKRKVSRPVIEHVLQESANVHRFFYLISPDDAVSALKRLGLSPFSSPSPSSLSSTPSPSPSTSSSVFSSIHARLLLPLTPLISHDDLFQNRPLLPNLFQKCSFDHSLLNVYFQSLVPSFLVQFEENQFSFSSSQVSFLESVVELAPCNPDAICLFLSPCLDKLRQLSKIKLSERRPCLTWASGLLLNSLLHASGQHATASRVPRVAPWLLVGDLLQLCSEHPRSLCALYVQACALHPYSLPLLRRFASFWKEMGGSAHVEAAMAAATREGGRRFSLSSFTKKTTKGAKQKA